MPMTRTKKSRNVPQDIILVTGNTRYNASNYYYARFIIIKSPLSFYPEFTLQIVTDLARLTTWFSS